jgi:hypothetical protein
MSSSITCRGKIPPHKGDNQSSKLVSHAISVFLSLFFTKFDVKNTLPTLAVVTSETVIS